MPNIYAFARPIGDAIVNVVNGREIISHTPGQRGMSLRDYTAVRVLTVLISLDEAAGYTISKKTTARKAYEYADALIEVRGEKRDDHTV